MTKPPSGKPYVYIYGTGWGSLIAELLTEQGYKVVGMWSYDEEELKAMEEKLSDIKITTTDKDVLFQYQNQKNKDKNPDAENTIVWVATPPFELAYIARQILEYGNNVVVEAPGVTTVEEGESLFASASKYATWHCLCPFQLRNLPAVRQLKSLISERKFGAVKSVEVRIQCNQGVICSNQYSWKYDKNRGGGALNMFGCHIIDLLSFILNDAKVDSVQGTLKNFVRKNEHINGWRSMTADDVCNFQLMFKSHKNNSYAVDDGLVAWVHISMLYPDTVFKQEVTVLTERASLVLENCELRVIPYQVDCVNGVMGEFVIQSQEKAKFTCSDQPPGAPLPYILGMKYFIDTINIHRLQTPYDEQPKTRLMFLQHIVKVTEKIRESSEQRQRRWISIEAKDTKVHDSKNKSSTRTSSSKGKVTSSHQMSGT